MEINGVTYGVAEVGDLLARLAVLERDNEALAAENARLAADASEAARALAAVAAERDGLRAEVERLAERVKEANARAFSPSTERASKVCPGQISLFNDAEAAAAGDSAEPGQEQGQEPQASGTSEASEAKGEGRKKGRKGAGRPRGSKVDFSGFAEVTSVVDLRLPDPSCPRCGSPMEEMGYDVVRTFELVPAHVEVTEYRVWKYRCPGCSRLDQETGGGVAAAIERAPRPALPLPGTLASASLLAHVMQSKYELALPINRVWSELGRIGLPVTRQTLCSWVIRAAGRWLGPLEAEVWRRVRGRPVLQVDETTVQVLREPGREPEALSYMWVAATGQWDPRPATHYEYHPGRGREYALALVGGCAGVCVTDAYAAYDDLGGVANSRCLAHVRRKFADIVKSVGEGAARAAGSFALEAIERIAAIYRAEGALSGLGPDERLRRRLEEVLPPVEGLLLRLVEVEPECAEGSSLAKAVAYAIHNVARMGPFFQNGLVPIDNNRAERSIRPFTVGRKNWLFSDTVAGAEASAAIYSLVETARANGLSAKRYLEWALTELPKARPSSPADYDRFMPWSDEARSACALRPGDAVPDTSEPLLELSPEEIGLVDRRD